MRSLYTGSPLKTFVSPKKQGKICGNKRNQHKKRRTPVGSSVVELQDLNPEPNPEHTVFTSIKKLSQKVVISFLIFFTFVFHLMLDPTPNSIPEP
jgi:hypothetical protein